MHTDEKGYSPSLRNIFVSQSPAEHGYKTYAHQNGVIIGGVDIVGTNRKYVIFYRHFQRINNWLIDLSTLFKHISVFSRS